MNLFEAKIQVKNTINNKNRWVNLNDYADRNHLFSDALYGHDWEIIDYEDIYDFLVDSDDVIQIYWELVKNYNESELALIHESIHDNLVENVAELRHILNTDFDKSAPKNSNNGANKVFEINGYQVEVDYINSVNFDLNDVINVPSLYYNKLTNKLVDTDNVIDKIVKRIMTTMSFDREWLHQLMNYLNIDDTNISLNQTKAELYQYIESFDESERVNVVYYLISTFTKQYNYSFNKNKNITFLNVATTEWIREWSATKEEFMSFDARVHEIFNAYSDGKICEIICSDLKYNSGYIYSDVKYNEVIGWISSQKPKK